MEGISRKEYIELSAPTEADSRSLEERILTALREKGYSAGMSLKVMRKLYPLCENAVYKLTASLAWDGRQWILVDLEAGDTTEIHYGLAVDLGSTTVVARFFDCNTGNCLAEDSAYNRQIAFGTDILTRIFYCKDQPEKLEEMRGAALESILEVLKKLEKKTGIQAEQCIQMVVAGNTTMIHFFLGLDAFCVFQTPYAVQVDRPGFLLAAELGIPVKGYVYCYPGKSNYLGGDIISGMVATELYKKDGISVFFDIGTNGELVVGNREFLLCGAGAAGPALEGGVVRTGMRAAEGAVESVRLTEKGFELGVIGGGEARGICGSGIIELLAELFLAGWIDLRGKFVPEKNKANEKGWICRRICPGFFFPIGCG
ncbi:MAG: ASKHA domain-containing protein [Blautia sp.]